jgi:dTDP-4-dehydrorhamnose 3,5-epimerase
MRFGACAIEGAFEILLDAAADERGTFATTFSAEAFAGAGLVAPAAQSAVSFSPLAGTVRGLHVQSPPHGQVKLVRCTAGAVLDVLVDVRESSPTRGRWCAFELTPRGGSLVYIPEGVAHGFQTLVPDTEVSYQFSLGQVRDAEYGVRYDDPAFGIDWPLPVSAISDRDRAWPDWKPA